jgi:energy-coupling factor transporter ATP-binding protein EcfA2
LGSHSLCRIWFVNIENCNNIKSGQITIREKKLNILFGRNGTGKSTVAKAIDLFSKNQSLDKLTPYGDSTKMPVIDGLGHLKIVIFNEDYVKDISFQRDSVIANAFDVFVRSPEYDVTKNKIDEALKNIRTTIINSQEIVILRKNISNLIEKIKLTRSGSIDKRGGSKGVLEGKSAFFNPPEELNGLKLFLRVIMFQNGHHGDCKDTTTLDQRNVVRIAQRVKPKHQKQLTKLL